MLAAELSGIPAAGPSGISPGVGDFYTRRLPHEGGGDTDRADAGLADRGFDAVEVEPSVFRKFGAVNAAAGDKEARDAGSGRAGDVGAQRIADRQNPVAVGNLEQT